MCTALVRCVEPAVSGKLVKTSAMKNEQSKVSAGSDFWRAEWLPNYI